jgi:hypothetical protein
MKRKYYILGVLATLYLLGTGYYAWTLNDAHRKQSAGCYFRVLDFKTIKFHFTSEF